MTGQGLSTWAGVKRLVGESGEGRAADVEGGAPRRVLMLASRFRMPYRVLRCATAGGAEAHVLGSAASRGLARSRFCKSHTISRLAIDGRFDPRLAEEIDRLAGARSIDLVFAGDADATRSLIAVVQLLDTPCFPMPSLALFDLLNDKWRFNGLCAELGLPTPRTQLFDDRSEFAKALRTGQIRPPLIAKPISMDGGEGCVVIRAPDETARALAKIDYTPVLAQQYVEGEDIGASILCRDGCIEAFLTHRYQQAIYEAWSDPAILADLGRLAAKLALTGVYNFDMRQTPDGRVIYLECNPRFFFKMPMSVLAGIDFFALGLGPPPNEPAAPAGARIAFPGALLRLGRTLRGRSVGDRLDWSGLRFMAQDPLPYLREKIGLEPDRPPRRAEG